MNNKSEITQQDMKALKKKIAIRFSLLPLFLGLIILLPAGTLKFWQCYTYFAVLLFKEGSEVLGASDKSEGERKETEVIIYFFNYYFSGRIYYFRFGSPLFLVKYSGIYNYNGGHYSSIRLSDNLFRLQTEQLCITNN
jgi:hypothetical protein